MSGRWRFAAASVAGVSHVRDGLRCQDSHGCSVIQADRSLLVAVVSDGAGSASEGARGSTIICASLLERVRLSRQASPDEAWVRRLVAETRQELLREAAEIGKPPRELAATLLFAIVSDTWSAFAQVGDGAIVTRERGTDSWNWLFWPHRGEYANTTFFLSDETALEQLEVDIIPWRQEEVALFTDGLQHLVLSYSEMTVHSPFFERMMQPVRRSRAAGEDRELSAGLASYLCSDVVSARADDDLTLVLASWSLDDEFATEVAG